MQVLADENTLFMIMDNLDSPQTLYNLVVVLPTAKAIFERCPRKILTATLSGLPSELEQLAILYIALIQDHHTPPSMIPLLDYLRLEDISDSVSFPVVAGDLKISKELSNPFEILRKLAAVCNAVEDFLSGFVDRSIRFIEKCKAGHAAGLETEHYHLGHKIRPLSHLWNQEETSDEAFSHLLRDKPQPWCVPLQASEIHRVKRAFWRLEILAALSHEPYTFPKESAVDSRAAEDDVADAIETWLMPQDYDEGTRILLTSLQPFELAELESIYDYLWCEMIGKAYQNKVEAFVAHYDEQFQQVQAERKGGISLHDVEQWEQDHAELQARVARKTKVEKAVNDHQYYLKYFMSLGLPFLHRVHQQITRDGGEIISENYPPLRYRSAIELRESWDDLDGSRRDHIWTSYFDDRYGRPINTGPSLRRAPEASPGASICNACALYLEMGASALFRVEDVWRAGCYMWGRAR